MPGGGAARPAALSELAGAAALSEAELRAAVEAAVAATYRRLVADDPEVVARVDPEAGSWRLVRPGGDGSEEAVPVSHPDFERQAAAAARGAVAARLAEAGARRVLREAESRHGELVDAIVRRPVPPRAGSLDIAWHVEVAGTPALLPPEEQIPGERLRREQHLKVVVLEGARRGRDAMLVVSRSHPLLLQRLLEQEVPELQSGQVQIRAIAREPGRRSKVAVAALRSDIDPQGACIGPRGLRQRAVTSELGEEQVQIVAWADDPVRYVANTLIPAAVTAVHLDEATHTAHVVVPTGQLSLAIGRGGENARLAARLCGWRIDISGGPGDA